MKKFLILPLLLLFSINLFADDFDDLFFDDLIETEVPEQIADQTESQTENQTENKTSGSEKKTTDIAKGILFNSDSLKINGSLLTKLSTGTYIFNDEKQNSLWQNITETKLRPAASAKLTFDARPSSSLRMYLKFSLNYPYKNTEIKTDESKNSPKLNDFINSKDFFEVEELFTDFSIKDTAFFRFGHHIISWGTNYFFTPANNILAASTIDFENMESVTEASLNLRTQIIFPDSQNCLYFYVIPDTQSFTDTSSTLNELLNTYQFPYDFSKTALAGKMDFVVDEWEISGGLYYKYQNSPKAMLTATGHIKKFNVFAEAVYQYGTVKEWNTNPDSFGDKTSIFKGTAGLFYIFAEPKITVALQYYYDSDYSSSKYNTWGHNLAFAAYFNKIGNTKLTASLLGFFYFNKESLPDSPVTAAGLTVNDGLDYSNLNPYSAIVFGSVNWKPLDYLSFSAGPFVTWSSWSSNPIVSLRISAKLGGGEF